jgi:hypothetical protein
LDEYIVKQSRILSAFVVVAASAAVLTACGSADTTTSAGPSSSAPSTSSTVPPPTSSGSNGTDVQTSPPPPPETAPAATSQPTGTEGELGKTSPPGTANFTKCFTFMHAQGGTQTYGGWVYSSQPNQVLQYWVRVYNVNVLPWMGTIYAGSHQASAYLWPSRSKWVSGPAMWSNNSRNRAYWASATIASSSDAATLAGEIWAPSCR